MAGFRQGQYVDGEEFYGLTSSNSNNFFKNKKSTCIINHMVFGQLSRYSFMTGRIHTLITSGFSHVGATHIILNMMGLCYFGARVRFFPCFHILIFVNEMRNAFICFL